MKRLHVAFERDRERGDVGRFDADGLLVLMDRRLSRSEVGKVLRRQLRDGFDRVVP